MNRIRSIALALVLWPSLALAQVTIPAGSNIQAAIDAAPPGTTFTLGVGIHRMQTITPRTGDRFVGEGDKQTTLSGARVLSRWSASNGRWYINGQTQQGAVVADVCFDINPRCSHPEDLWFDGVLKRHVGSLAAVVPGTWFFDYAADRIWVGDNPTNALIETSVTPSLTLASGASDVSFDNLIIERYAATTGSAAVVLGASSLAGYRWSLTNSIVRHNHGAGIWMDTLAVARNNKVYLNAGFGFVGAGADILVEGNEISYNNMGLNGVLYGYNFWWGAGGSKWVYTTRLVVRGNYSHHNGGLGLWTDIANIYTLYENNVVEDNVEAGISHEISYEAVIRNNVLRRNGTSRYFPGWVNGAGIQVLSSRNVEIYGNILENNWQGITAWNDWRGAGIHGAYNVFGLFVHHNTIVTTLGGGGGRSGVLDTGDGSAFTAGNLWWGNIYTLLGSGPAFIWKGGELTEEEWKAAGQDAR